MNIVFVFLLFLTILIVIGIVIHKSHKFEAPKPVKSGQPGVTKYNATLPQNEFLPTPTWSQPEPYNSNTTGNCFPYTFIAGQSVPAQPSYATLNGGTRDYVVGNTSQTCIDVDQLFAQTITHKCLYPNTASSGSGCILTVPTYVPSLGQQLYPGDFAPLGTVEGDPTIGTTGFNSSLLYSPCTPTNLANTVNNTPYCLGNIGLIIPNFIPQSQAGIAPGGTGYNLCLSAITDNVTLNGPGNYNTSIQQCDLSETNQIYRMVRYTYDPVAQTITQDDGGNLASIVHRATGYYLAPDLVAAPIKNNGYNYIFDQLKINYTYPNPITDYTGNTGIYEAVNLILINPAYDSSRNGVYWLLQDQTPNPAYSTSTYELPLGEVGYNSYVNQLNYSTVFPLGPSVPSYWYNQTVVQKYPSYPLTVPNGFKKTSCLFDIHNPGAGEINSIGVTGVLGDIAPQQIVYVPDYKLLPTDPEDIYGVWSYLVNSFSINMSSPIQPLGQTGSAVPNQIYPILTPYRQKSSFTVTYDCKQDPTKGVTAGTNLFTYLSTATPPKIEPTVYSGGPIKVFGDSQFINYSKYVQQIQMGVSAYTEGTNTNYNSKKNPFN